MREELKARSGKRGKFSGTVQRFGQKAYKSHVTVTCLFVDVKDESGALVTDHLWFRVGKQMQELDLQPGDRVEFEARVMPYRKGYCGRRDDDYDERPAPGIDYGLKNPTKVKKIGRTAPELAGLPATEVDDRTASSGPFMNISRERILQVQPSDAEQPSLFPDVRKDG